jgi:hypothetical protein
LFCVRFENAVEGRSEALLQKRGKARSPSKDLKALIPDSKKKWVGPAIRKGGNRHQPNK